MKGNVVGPPGGFTYLVSSSLAEEGNILLCTHEVCSPIPHGSSTVRFTTNQTVLLGSDKFKVERERERERESASETATELPMAHTKHTILPTTSDWEKAKTLHSHAHSQSTFVFQKQEKETGKRLPSRD
jgi:hypothetical protein